VERVAVVGEAAIEDGIRFLARAHGLVAEGAAAVPVASLLVGAVEPGTGSTVLVVSGRNIALERLAHVFGTSTPAG
jgi:threonine dehydratase